MTSIVTPTNLGSEFDIGLIEPSKIRIKLGQGLVKNVADEIEVSLVTATQTVTFDRGFLVSSLVTVGQNVNDNDIIRLDPPVRADVGWTSPNNTTVSYTGSPDRAHITAMIHNDGNLPGSQSNAAPTLRLQRSNGGAFVDITSESATGYIRDGATGHTESSNTISYTDHAPGVNPTYRLVSRQEATQGSSINSRELSHLSIEAIEVVTVNVLTGVAAI